MLLSAAWGLGVAWFHRAFVHATVIGVVLAMFAGLTMTSFRHSREDARRTAGIDRLRYLGTAFQAANDYRTPSQETLSPAKQRRTPANGRGAAEDAFPTLQRGNEVTLNREP